ncbi:hypothetical protein AB1Y20_012846 [Prymnesium parvum]|uniref:Uncharacterized protein n=1 Tax=Prymnesium parvum TaxID=97485 RepID=A0AB34ILX4_PRYPA
MEAAVGEGSPRLAEEAVSWAEGPEEMHQRGTSSTPGVITVVTGDTCTVEGNAESCAPAQELPAALKEMEARGADGEAPDGPTGLSDGWEEDSSGWEDMAVDPSRVLQLMRVLLPSEKSGEAAGEREEAGEGEEAVREGEEAEAVEGGEKEAAMVDACCTLWDLSTSPAVSRFMCSHHLVALLHRILAAPSLHSPRLLELCVGTLANLAAHPSLCAPLSPALPCLTRLLHSSADAPTLLELLRLFTAAYHSTPRLHARLAAAAARLLQLMANTLRDDLLHALCQLLCAMAERREGEGEEEEEWVGAALPVLCDRIVEMWREREGGGAEEGGGGDEEREEGAWGGGAWLAPPLELLCALADRLPPLAAAWLPSHAVWRVCGEVATHCPRLGGACAAIALASQSDAFPHRFVGGPWWLEGEVLRGVLKLLLHTEEEIGFSVDPPPDLLDGVRAAWTLLHDCSAAIDGLSLYLEPERHGAPLQAFTSLVLHRPHQLRRAARWARAAPSLGVREVVDGAVVLLLHAANVLLTTELWPDSDEGRSRLRLGVEMLHSSLDDSDASDGSPAVDHTLRGSSGFDSSPEGVGWQWADDHSEVSQCSCYDSGAESVGEGVGEESS